MKSSTGLLSVAGVAYFAEYIQLIILQDFLWVLGSIMLLIAQPFHISYQGNYSIAIVSTIVLWMAVNQSSALGQIDSTVSDRKMKTLSFNRKVNASKEKGWEAISDVGNFHKVAPNLTDVKILSEKKERKDMIRSCSHNKDTWTETCSNWEPGDEYSFVVNIAAPDYPYPLKYLKGTFKVEGINKETCTITMKYEFIYKRRIYNILIHPFMKPKFKKTCEKILDNWQVMIEKN